MSVYGAYVLSISRPCYVQDRNRRGVFAYFFSWEKKVGPGAGTAHKENKRRRQKRGPLAFQLYLTTFKAEKIMIYFLTLTYGKAKQDSKSFIRIFLTYNFHIHFLTDCFVSVERNMTGMDIYNCHFDMVSGNIANGIIHISKS